MRHFVLPIGVALAVLASASGIARPAKSVQAGWRVIPLEAGSEWVATAAVAINDHGQIIGDGCPPVGGCNELHAFIWQNGKIADLGTLSSVGGYARATGINDSGQVVGESYDKTRRLHAVLWEHARIRDLRTLPRRDSSTAAAINELGQIVGSSGDARSDETHAFLWRNGKMTDLGTLGGKSSTARAINDKGQIVGTSDTKSGAHHAFLWQNGQMTDLGTLGGKSSSARAINDNGQVVGMSDTKSGEHHAFVWQGGKLTDLGELARSDPCGQETPIAIGDGGHVAGSHETTRRESRPFVWANRHLSNLPLPHQATGGSASAVNGRGQIVGSCNVVSALALARACLWENGRATVLGIIGDPGHEAEATACAINDNRQIVGKITYRMDFGQAVLWTPRTAH